MKVIIEKSKFVDSVKKLNEITTKGTAPIVNCITFEVANHDVVMGAYNIAQARYITIRKVTEVDREYKFAINSDKLYKLLSVIKSQFVSIDYDDTDDKITLDIGTKIKFDNVLTNAEDYVKPDYVANPVRCQLTFMSNSMSAAINSVEWAYSRNKEEHRSALKGVCFDVCTNDNIVTAVATDGAMLAVYELMRTQCIIDKDAEAGRYIIPNQAIKSLCNIEGVMVNLHFTDKYAIAFANSDDIVITKLIEAVYPTWKQVVPTSFNFTYLTDSKVFNDGLKHIMKVMKVMDVEPVDQIIRFTFNDCVAKMHHQSKVKKEPIVIEHDTKLPFVTSQLPDGFSFNFNADRLQRVLASFDGNVKWSINESMTPIKFSVDEQYYVIAMPCRG